MSQPVSNPHGSPARDADLGARTSRWTWWLYLRWSLLLAAASLGMAIAAAVGFVFLVVVPMAYLFEVRLVRYAFQVPMLVVPVVWTLGMVRCYRRQPSATLMLALAATGVVLYVVMPIAMLWIVLSAGGGWAA